MNIEETTKDATKVDMTLAPQPKLDLSSIRANVDAIQAEALRLNDIIQAMPKQDSTAKGSTTSPTPMDSTGKMQVPQLQQKTEEQRMAEFQNQRQMSFQAMGITEEDFNKRQNLATQMSSLNAQLQQLDVAEQQAMLDIENLMPGALLSRVRGEQAQVQRTLSFKKAGIAAQMSALSGEYSAIQGRIDEAQNFFNQYIEYATFEKKQEMDDYKWALDFYQDIDESEKKWLQQEYENKRSEYEFDVNQKNEEARIAIARAQEERLGKKDTEFKPTGFSEALSFALQQTGSPEQAAQDVFEQFGEMYKLNYQDLLREAQTMANEIPENPEETSGDWELPGEGGAEVEQISELERLIRDMQEQNKEMGYPKNTGIREDLVRRNYDIREIDKIIHPISSKVSDIGRSIIRLFSGK